MTRRSLVLATAVCVAASIAAVSAASARGLGGGSHMFGGVGSMHGITHVPLTRFHSPNARVRGPTHPAPTIQPSVLAPDHKGGVKLMRIVSPNMKRPPLAGAGVFTGGRTGTGTSQGSGTGTGQGSGAGTLGPAPSPKSGPGVWVGPAFAATDGGTVIEARCYWVHRPFRTPKGKVVRLVQYCAEPKASES